MPAVGVERAECSHISPVCGMALATRTGMHGSPHQRYAAAGVDPTRQQELRQGRQRAERSNDVLSQLRPRHMAAGAAQDDVDLVDGGGDRPDLQGDLADIGTRSQSNA